MCFMYIGGVDGMSCNVTSSDSGTASHDFTSAGDSVVLETDDDEQLYISCTIKTICAQYSTAGEQHEVRAFQESRSWQMGFLYNVMDMITFVFISIVVLSPMSH